MADSRAGAYGPSPAGGRDSSTIEAAVEALSRGQPVVIPTDTVYGLAVLASAAGATRALFALKDRSTDQPVAVLVDGVDAARSLIDPPLPVARRLMDAFWPGPVTLVLRRGQGSAGLELGGDGTTIGLRCPGSELVRDLARRLGPIVTTSANRHGEPTSPTASGATDALTGPVAATIDGGVLAGLPSTVVDCTVDPPRVLREGAVPADRIHAVISTP